MTKEKFLIMKTAMSLLKKNSKEYWQQRCTYLEISIDPTYTASARAEARELYKMLVTK